jgi:hypothetical protein
MLKNMGNADRIIRISLAILIVIFYLAGSVSGTTAVILGIAAALFLITGSVGVCPAYLLFKINTNKKIS